jgi:hypothetical protein
VTRGTQRAGLRETHLTVLPVAEATSCALRRSQPMILALLKRPSRALSVRMAACAATCTVRRDRGQPRSMSLHSAAQRSSRGTGCTAACIRGHKVRCNAR